MQATRYDTRLKLSLVHSWIPWLSHPPHTHTPRRDTIVSYYVTNLSFGKVEITAEIASLQSDIVPAVLGRVVE